MLAVATMRSQNLRARLAVKAGELRRARHSRPSASCSWKRALCNPLVSAASSFLIAAGAALIGPAALAAAPEPAVGTPAAPSDAKSDAKWLGEELPLPLSVKTPQDLALKAAAERQYLVFNLLARGKLSWDQGDFAGAASKWESLLRIPGIDPELDRILRPMASEARERAGSTNASPTGALPATGAVTGPVTTEGAGAGVGSAARAVVPVVSVSGQVSGSAAGALSGAVLWLKRADGPTPRPTPFRSKTMSQVNKTFVPRVLAVPVGSTISFANQDPIFHNVFSLSKPNDFDSGLFKAGQTYARTFSKAGPVQVLCNIHSSMMGYVVVVDSPWYTQADVSGTFVIRGVPAGAYDLEAWHEGSSQIARSRITVGADGLRGLNVRLNADRRGPVVVPDKFGKERPLQAGH